MMARNVSLGFLAIFATLLTGVALLALPTHPDTPWCIAVAGLALSIAAMGRSLLGAVAGGVSSAGLWLRGAGALVAAFWAFGSLAQGMTASMWSWRVATVVQVLVAALWGVVALVTGAAAQAAQREALERAATLERHQRLIDAARAVLDHGRTGVRADVAERVLRSRPGELGDALAEEELEEALRGSRRRT